MQANLPARFQALMILLLLVRLVGPSPAQACGEVPCGHKNTIVVKSGMIVGGIRSGNGHDTIIVEDGAQVLSEGTRAVGIDSGNGHDTVINRGTITVLASALQEAGASVNPCGPPCGSRCAGSRPDAAATAVGIDTGNGKDSVLNTGTISVSAAAVLTDSGSARSLAIGIDTGNGKDSSKNDECGIVSENPSGEGGALIEVTATATASLSDSSWELAGRGEVDLSVDTQATAVGIVGGNGKDSICNAGTLAVSALSDIGVEGTSATLFGVGSVNMSIHGSAFAVGILGGNGKDQIVNQGDITVSAVSTIETDGIAVSGFGAAQINDADFDGSTRATATAVGIDTGNAKDVVLGSGSASSIDVQATASVNADSYALTLAGDAISDTSLTATAAATGILSGSGKDTIANEGTLTVGAEAGVESLSVELNLLDIFKSRADLEAQAAAAGIDSGSGNDAVTNSGTLSVTAAASTEAWVAELNVFDVAIGDFSSSSTAEAAGIATGQGKDAITNTGTITVQAEADALVGNFTLTMVDLTLIPDLLDTVGNASTTVQAEAVGISSGAQDDVIFSSGDITATAATEAITIAVGVGAEGIPAGVPEGDILSFENLASAGVSVSSAATGIDSGTGDDQITNQGTITVDASATSWGGSLSLSAPLLEKIVPFPSPAFAMISAGTDVGSAATGIQAGEGDDLILNDGDLDIRAASSALNVAASLAFQGFVSDINTIDIAAARVDALTEATAVATGIDGGEGNDRIVNSGDITVEAISETLSIGAAVAIQKKASEAVNLEGTLADVRAMTTAEATGISGGVGDDTITSSGDMRITAESRNAGVALSAAVTCESEKGLTANAAVAKADTTATATAVGIGGGEGSDTIHNSGDVEVRADAATLSAAVALTLQGSNTKVIGLQGALATATTTAEATAVGLSGGAGNDNIVNQGDLNVEADALAIAAAVAVDIMPGKTKGLGIALADAQNTATAAATGISGGEGDECISNAGAITVDADATAVAASLSVVRHGAAGSGTLDPVSFDSGNVAEAVAVGIDGGTGDETIVNSGALTVSSTAVAPSVGVAVAAKGVSAAITTATASASATGIDTGTGTHWIHNTGAISADAHATAVGVSVSVAGEGLAVGLDTVWDGGTSATATAAGIRADSGCDTIISEAAIDASATAVAPSVAVAITGKGVSVGISTATASASATGIDSGAGDDRIDNSGAITSTAYANADAISIDISGKGAAISGNDVWDGGVEAAAVAKGIDAGAGNNTVVNSGSITADSTAVTASVGVSIVGKGLSASVSTATATAESVGIDPGAATESLWNSGDITAAATATAVTVNVDIAGKGVAAALDEVWDGGTTARATARGIAAGSVDNRIWNQGTIVVDSEATTPSVGVAIAGKGLSAALTTSTATADAVGIDTREGDDVVQNSGAITAIADAEAYAISVAVAGKGVAVAGDAVWDGGTTATARAAGIDSGAGDDSIVNTADIRADSTATTVSVGVSVAGAGISAAVSTSTAQAAALAITTGEGADRVDSIGSITARATSTAVTANVDVTGKGIAVAADAVWDGGTKSTAVAKGIDTGAGDDWIQSKGDITATSDAVTVGVGVAVAGKGITLATTTSTTNALATAIDGGAGSDTIRSEGNVTAEASSTGVSVAAAITGSGVAGAADAVWDGGTKSTAAARGIDAGAGDDIITSKGDITARSEATTVAVDVAVTATGISAATSTATTAALAAGIDGGAGSDTIQSEGAITADASATGVAVAASITGKGVSAAFDAVWDGGTHTAAAAKGIDAGDGDNVIRSTGDIMATSEATTVAVDAAISAAGISLASSTATTEALSVGIASGSGSDTIQSEGAITADASATGVAVAVGITGAGVSGAFDAVWDGGTDTTAAAKGIDSGDGDDVIRSVGAITAIAEADTVAVDVAITGKGIAVAATTSTTTALATGIDAGAGKDIVDNTAEIVADASASGVGVAAGLTGLGLSGATDAVWDSGTRAVAIAKGIDAGSGDDTVRNTGDILVTAEASTVSVDVAFTAAGLTAAMTNTSVEARATGIDGGDGADLIHNQGDITGSAEATAVGVAVSLSGAGASVSASDVWDNGVSGEALFAGISGGSGDDTIVNSGAITGTSETTTPAVAVSVTLAGIGAAANTATAEARAFGIDGGEGDDHITNTGAISVSSSADANTVIVSATLAGGAGGIDSIWDGGTTATAAATGIAGGEGNDLISNTASIEASATAATASTGVTVVAAGASASLVNSTATAQGTGIAGGAGHDTISNSGSITAYAQADADTVAVSVSGIGASFAGDQWSENTRANATAIGIDAGEGNDTIGNTAAIAAEAVSHADATAVTVSLVGYADSEAENLAEALAAGICGGAGSDVIDNSGAITVAGTATAEAAAVTVNLAGAATAEAGTTAEAVGIGIDGGAGDDTIRSSGDLSIAAAAVADASSVTVALIGYGDSEAGTLASALATGIAGGEGNDTIRNSGDITLTSSATAEAGNVSIGLAGAVFGEAGTTATAAAVGLDGGAGADVIENSGVIAATVSASTDSSSTGVVLLGYGDSSAESSAVATVTGISGGAGDDMILNTGSITLSSTATAAAGGVQVGLVGAVGGEAGTTATATATGIDGGAGDDTIRNAAVIEVTAATSTSADNTTVGIFGTAESEVSTHAVTVAAGIAGGEGADLIENTGNISVTSGAAMSLDAYAFDFGGSAAGQGTLAADSSAVGISGGSGDDAIDNDGQISVSAEAAMTVAGGSDVAFGSASAGANTTAVTKAVGIDAGEGDDTIRNRNTITVSAVTTMTLDSSSFSFAGKAASGEGAMSASTRAVGISGGDGSDTILSEAAVTVSPETALSAVSGSDVAFGSAAAGTSITAGTEGVGIEAGAGDDTVINRGGITVGHYSEDPAEAMTRIDVSGSTWSFGGTGSVSAAALATGSSVGIDAGSGDDTVVSEADITVSSTAYARTHGSSYTFAGTSGSSGVVTAAASAVGISGGEGDDTIVNSAEITVRARAQADSTGSSSTTFGSTSAYAGATASALAWGIDGGAGDEVIENTGTIQAEAYAQARGTTDSKVFAGSPKATSEASVLAFAAGIDAGAGNNTVDNRGVIAAAATAVADPSATADSDMMRNEATSTSSVSATAVGISALDGDDAISNSQSGSIVAEAAVTATPYAHSDESSSAIGVAPAAVAQGIQAGDGENTVVNLGTIRAAAEAAITATGVSRSLTLTASSGALAVGAVEAAGVTAGQGNDLITNAREGTIEVRATATGTALGTPRPGEGAHNEYGTAMVGFLWVPLSARASGISAGNGDNSIENLGLIDVEAGVLAEAYAKADTDTTRNAAAANALVSAAASGISAGDGADTIRNAEGATIEVKAATEVSAYAHSDEDSQATAVAHSAARGIEAGDGDNTVVNLGTIRVAAEAAITATGVSRSRTFTASSSALAGGTVEAVGVSTGRGADVIVNGRDGTIEARATATGTALGTPRPGESGHNEHGTAAVGVGGSPLSATAAGISSGDGDDTIDNLGVILAEAGVAAEAKGQADTVTTTTTARANAAASAAAYGISAGHGANTVRNQEGARIEARASSQAKAAAYADENAYVDSPGAWAASTACGIQLGDSGGAVAVENRGWVSARAEAETQATAVGDDNTSARGTATSRAAGIEVGDNAVLAVDNSGTIEASASARDSSAAVASVSATSVGVKAGNGDGTLSNSGTIRAYSNSQAIWISSKAEAAGIQVGAGDKQIVNDGAIEATATSTVGLGAGSARAYGIRALGGSNTIINNGTIISSAAAYGMGSTAQAYGIQTGSGDDLIINNGTITTSVVTAMGVSTKGIGIDTGSGNDHVVLGDGSYIGCDLYLGEGNDRLTVIGSGSISGNVYGGAGTDGLVLDGATNFSLDKVFEFESLMKLGSNLVSLTNTLMLEQIEVYEGILQISDDYQFLDTGVFSAKVYGGGGCGQLVVDGTLGLDGTMTVLRGPGAYLDGASYDVLSAGGLSGSFAAIVLPNPTALLRFALAETGGNNYLVTASTEPFATVATNTIERSVTRHLDAIVASAEGDLSFVLGEIQAMPAKGYAKAFSSLSPDSYGSSTRSTFSTADQFAQVLGNRLRSLRSSVPARAGAEAVRPLIERTAFGVPGGRIAASAPAAAHGLWLSGFGQWGGFAPAEGYTGYDFNLAGTALGWDRHLSDNLTAGASLGYANTEVSFGEDRGAGLLKAVTGSLYGSYSSEGLYFDTALSYGRQGYENARNVEVGELKRTAQSAHGGNALSAYLGGGFVLGRQPWTLEPVGCLQYVRLHEEAFAEQGAGSVSLNVEERITGSLLSDVGLRLGLSLGIGRLNLASELYAAWRHDFGIDEGAITATFADAPQAPFTIAGPETQANGLVLGASLLARGSSRFSGALKYTLELRGPYRANSLVGEIQYGF